MLKKFKWSVMLVSALLVSPLYAAEDEAVTEQVTESAVTQPAVEKASPQAASSLYMEINKLEQRDDLCVAYVRFSNQTENEFTELKSELFAFNKEEIITAHFLADFQRVTANKTVVKLVPMKGAKCDEIDSILLNRMVSCKSGGGEVANCMGMIRTGTKASVRLFK